MNNKHWPKLNIVVWFSIHDPSSGRSAEKDVDPAQFSREFMRKASSLVEDEEVSSFYYDIISRTNYMLLFFLWFLNI